MDNKKGYKIEKGIWPEIQFYLITSLQKQAAAMD